MIEQPELILICCEGNTEAAYFSILKKRFRLPTFIKVIPDSDTEYCRLGQHEHLIDMSNKKRMEYADEFSIQPKHIEVWAVCDRDNYKDSFTKLDNYATSQDVLLAFSDPQFENYLLQHFSLNKSTNKKAALETELSNLILSAKPQYAPYCKGNLDWLDEMLDEKHSIVNIAVKNANVFSNHTKQPFFTVQKLVERLLSIQ